MTDFDHPLLDKLRALCRELPETGEKISWGHPNFTAGGRMFAAFGVYQGRPRMGIATSLDEQAFLVQDPRFEVASYVGKYGWVSVWLDLDPEWDLLEQLLRGAHERILAKSSSSNKAKRTTRATRKKATTATKPSASSSARKRPTNRR